MVLSQYNPLETHIVNYLCQFFLALQTIKCQHKKLETPYTLNSIEIKPSTENTEALPTLNLLKPKTPKTGKS